MKDRWEIQFFLSNEILKALRKNNPLLSVNMIKRLDCT